MDALKDLVFRYCVIFGRRFFIKEKIAFLRTITKELLQLGYAVDTKVAKQQLTNKKSQNYYNAYIGDLSKADILICTHYDTGINYHNLCKTTAFNQVFNNKYYFIGLIPVFILLIASILLNYFLFLPKIQTDSFLSVYGVGSVLTTVVLFYFILRYRNGVPNKRNFVCNSSSIILILNLIKKLDKKQKKNIAFVLMDGGCSTQFGLRMLENYDKNITDKTVIFLDSIGNGDELVIMKPESQTPINIDTKTVPGKIVTSFKHYLLISSGQLNERGEVEIYGAFSRKDNQLSTDRLENHTHSILAICKNLIQSHKEFSN